MLRRGVLVERVLDGDAGRLETLDRPTADVGALVVGGEVEVDRVVERHRRDRGVVVLQVEELDLGCAHELEALGGGRGEVAPQDLSRVALERLAVQVGNVAEDAGGQLLAVGAGHELEAVRIGVGEHVALLHPAEPVDGGTVELHALLEGRVELHGGDGDRLDLAEHVGEPEPNQPDPSFLDGPQHVVLLVIHSCLHPGRELRLGCVSILAATASGGVGTSPS